LNELLADEPNLKPAPTMGGSLAWGDSWVGQTEAQRDRVNAPAMRPHVIGPCQQLSRYPALALRCACPTEPTLVYLALATFATGVLVVSSPRLLLAEQRGGGTHDLADVYEPTKSWSLLPWEAWMRVNDTPHGTSWKNPDTHPLLGPGASVIGDTAKRHKLRCQCGADFTYHNVTLLEYVLRSIAAGEHEVRLRAYSTPKGGGSSLE
jgi:hypothetical protein